VVSKELALYADFRTMGKILPKVVRWQPSETPNVSYRLYWATCAAVSHNIDYAEVGTVTRIILPRDIPKFPLITAKIVLGVSAVAQSGTESDIITVTTDIDFTIPEAPRHLRVEDS
jgi:hypothetical protein